MSDTPLIIRHRRNRPEELAATPTEFGIEVDLRSAGSELIVAHDPFVPGVPFAEWVRHYRHRLAIFNLKEEGLEEETRRVATAAGIVDFFFLDQSFPFLIKTALAGERRCCVRVSEFESIETALAMAPHVDWVWLDTFSRLPIDGKGARRLAAAGLKTCLVSPDLLGRAAPEDFSAMQDELSAERIVIDAVCTKQPERWLGWMP